jgi:hypothetical protein
MRRGLFPCLFLLACSGPGGPPGGASDGGDPTGDGGDTPGDAGGPCAPGARSCPDVEHQRECVEVAGEPTWVESACAPHEYCLDDRCAPACLDECPLGARRGSGDAAEVCGLYSTETGGFVSPGPGSHDLARRHLAWLREHHLANGYVANTLFASTAYTTPVQYTGTVDAAEWTGVYLAAESLRALTTHSPDAIRNVEDIVERIHQLFEVTGTPGYMARIWAPLDGDPLLADLYDPADSAHFAITYDGGPAFYHAWTSRDMYAGVSAGLGLAYDATSSSEHRRMLRAILVTLARELMEPRVDVPVRVRFHLFGSWQETDLAWDMEHVVLVPDEMVDGRVFIQIGSEADPSDYGQSELRGAREFAPDLQPVLSQTPGIGGLVPSIPRPGSALMLANFLELALHVTEGVPGAEEDHAAIAAYYQAHKASWLAVMKQYAYHNEENCWSSYFGLTIAHHPVYSLLRLSDDAAYAAEIRSAVLGAEMRPFVEGHHNPYFDYIAAVHDLVPAAELETTSAQLAGFVPPPKASVAVNHQGAYPADPDCPGLSTQPVDIADRVPMDFLWQHHPFRLVNQFVHAEHVYPGTDYLIAYWLGRHHGFLEDDAPDTCTRWRPD